ncbi:Tol-Pal system-associated acyl-CoA thioesterase [Achromobacter sp. HZ01]|uniref:Tol-pal system-associated acyl-CoA thioesterase n=1 Tax=Achromobacter pulmonis TaxID=1389932 RepID=A0A2N8KAS2_9BURK|nr:MULTISPECIES: tol-pal system-associated acyl-CoA thioesterase [Achromobacter]MBO9332930.1 tol-pal system-associated acyl-CoA thioesterase [Achromobacter xylosoxidans]PND30553.1 tol-pal system-associated acyl-CoA thioesterase [Achromobacter pulmonis]RAP60570.1 Tol-Pal system-associated acyl-CoA thioesterase [Achromobacter sp. HZ01]
MTAPKFPESILQVRVYYEDTDAGGVVFYANYLKFLERARTEWLRDLGVNQSALAASEQRLFVVHSLDMSYRKPARLDDLLTIRSRITRLGRASIHFAQRAERDGELLAEGNIQVCCVDAIHMRPAELPADVRAKLKFIQE